RRAHLEGQGRRDHRARLRAGEAGPGERGSALGSRGFFFYNLTRRQGRVSEGGNQMGSRAEALADKFQQAVAEFASTIERIPDEKWSAKGGSEGWTVAGVAQHVSGQFPLEMQYITAAAESKPMPSYSWDDIN